MYTGRHTKQQYQSLMIGVLVHGCLFVSLSLFNAENRSREVCVVHEQRVSARRHNCCSFLISIGVNIVHSCSLISIGVNIVKKISIIFIGVIIVQSCSIISIGVNIVQSCSLISIGVNIVQSCSLISIGVNVIQLQSASIVVILYGLVMVRFMYFRV